MVLILSIKTKYELSPPILQVLCFTVVERLVDLGPMVELQRQTERGNSRDVANCLVEHSSLRTPFPDILKVRLIEVFDSYTISHSSNQAY